MNHDTTGLPRGIARLSFGWWNTSLSPPRKANRATPQERALAAGVVRLLLHDAGIDCLALGEVSSEDLEFLSDDLGTDFQNYFGSLKGARAQFDTGAIFNRSRMRLIDHFSHTEEYGKSILKVANRITFSVDMSLEPIHLLISHWPSRIWCEENGAERHALGLRLRDVVSSVCPARGKASFAVLLGDYNDEPFDETLEGLLLATRDRELANRTGVHFYNPFWRCLGEREPHVPGKDTSSFSGTCYHRSGKQTRWRTFDQIMFSSSFLSSDTWQLNESLTRVIQFGPIAKLITSSGSIFDHFPVLSVIEKPIGG